MLKQEYLAQLRKGLSGLSQSDIEERVTFYSEMIEDRMEEGLSEEDAVSAVGSVPEIIAQITAETPPAKAETKGTQAKRRLGAGEIVLLVLGSPLWLSLSIAAVAVTFSLYISLWSVIISLWAAFGSFAACSVSGIVACVVCIAEGNKASGLVMLAAGLVCTGLSIFTFYGCKAVTKGTLRLTKKMAVWIQNRVQRKGAIQ